MSHQTTASVSCRGWPDFLHGTNSQYKYGIKMKLRNKTNAAHNLFPWHHAAATELKEREPIIAEVIAANCKNSLLDFIKFS